MSGAGQLGALWRRGNDTMVAYGAGGDSMVGATAGGDQAVGNTGNSLFVANDLLSASDFSVNDLITVEDFATSNGIFDNVSLSSKYSAQTDSVDGLGYRLEENDQLVGNATDALSAADGYFANDANAAQYLFIYGSSGAGYLFYNGDAGGSAANDGMILLGVNAESSLSANDIVASNFAA